jgi:hypothetical protein
MPPDAMQCKCREGKGIQEIGVCLDAKIFGKKFLHYFSLLFNKIYLTVN